MAQRRLLQVWHGERQIERKEPQSDYLVSQLTLYNDRHICTSICFSAILRCYIVVADQRLVGLKWPKKYSNQSDPLISRTFVCTQGNQNCLLTTAIHIRISKLQILQVLLCGQEICVVPVVRLLLHLAVDGRRVLIVIHLLLLLLLLHQECMVVVRVRWTDIGPRRHRRRDSGMRWRGHFANSPRRHLFRKRFVSEKTLNNWWAPCSSAATYRSRLIQIHICVDFYVLLRLHLYERRSCTTHNTIQLHVPNA